MHDPLAAKGRLPSLRMLFDCVLTNWLMHFVRPAQAAVSGMKHRSAPNRAVALLLQEVSIHRRYQLSACGSKWLRSSLNDDKGVMLARPISRMTKEPTHLPRKSL